MPTLLSFERYPVDPASEDAFLPLLMRHVEEVRGRPGVLWADAGRAMDDGGSFVVWSEWRTAADLEAWETAVEATRFLEEADAHLSDRPTRRRFESA